MNYIEIGYGFIFVIILHQLTDFILGACKFFCHDENYCDDDYKRSDGVKWVDKPASPSIPISFATGQSSRPPLSATEDDSEIRTENSILPLL